MKRIHFYAAAALTLTALACNRHDEKAGNANTTSAPLDPVDRSGVAQPPAFMTDGGSSATGQPMPIDGTGRTTGAAPANPDPNKSLTGPTTTPPAGTMGTTNGTGTAGANDSTTPSDPNGNFGGVAPGHIMVPPGSARGTGQPNDNGSHNMGSTQGAGRR